MDWGKVENYSVVRWICTHLFYKFFRGGLAYFSMIMPNCTRHLLQQPGFVKESKRFWSDLSAVQIFHQLETFGASWNTKYNKKKTRTVQHSESYIRLEGPETGKHMFKVFSYRIIFISIFNCELMTDLWDFLMSAFCFHLHFFIGLVYDIWKHKCWNIFLRVKVTWSTW